MRSSYAINLPEAFAIPIIYLNILKAFVDKLTLANSRDIVKYYAENYQESHGKKLIILYMNRKDQLVTEEHLRNYGNFELLSLSIMNHVLLHKVPKIAVIRRDNAINLAPTKRDVNFLQKLTPLLNDLRVTLQDYLIFSRDDYYSFKADAGIIK